MKLFNFLFLAISVFAIPTTVPTTVASEDYEAQVQFLPA